MELEAQIREKIDRLVAEITELAYAHALESVASALKGGNVPSFGPGAVLDGSEKRRTTRELHDLGERVCHHVEQNPGARAEDIALAFRTDTRSLKLPLRTLVASGRIRKEGVKRATRYYSVAADAGDRRDSDIIRRDQPTVTRTVA